MLSASQHTFRLVSLRELWIHGPRSKIKTKTGVHMLHRSWGSPQCGTRPSHQVPEAKGGSQSSPSAPQASPRGCSLCKVLDEGGGMAGPVRGGAPSTQLSQWLDSELIVCLRWLYSLSPATWQRTIICCSKQSAWFTTGVWWERRDPSLFHSKSLYPRDRLDTLPCHIGRDLCVQLASWGSGSEASCWERHGVSTHPACAATQQTALHVWEITAPLVFTPRH